MPVRSSRPRVPLALAALTALAGLSTALAGCGSADESSPPSTTTGIATTEPISTSTTVAGSADGGGSKNDVPGLWIVAPNTGQAGGWNLTDEEGTVWATTAPGQVIHAPISDGLGGVAYIQCADSDQACQLQDAATAGATPRSLGAADSLLAAGSVQGRPTLLIGATDPSIEPSFQDDRSSKVARLVDVQSGQITPINGWYGWESGPFAAAIGDGRFAACFGEGETCAPVVGTTPDQLTPVPGADANTTVVSMALSPDGTRLTWATMVPMGGGVSLHLARLDQPTEPIGTVTLDSSNTTVDDVVTDGAWVAARSGRTVTLSQLADTGPLSVTGSTGTRSVPDGTTDIAIREAGGAAGPALDL